MPARNARRILRSRVLPVWSAIVAVTCLCCSTARGAKPASSSVVVLALQYVSGGETPFGFRISVFEAGSIELQSPRGTTLLKELSPSELDGAKAIIVDSSVVEALRDATESAVRVCCEPEEVLLEVGIDRKQYRVVLEGMEAPSEIRGLFEFVNALGKRHFGNEYSLPVSSKK